MLKGPSFIFSDLHLSVIKCHFQSYDVNISQKFKKKSSFVILGEWNKFEK